MMRSVLAGGSILIAGVLYFLAVSQAESSTQLPSWQKLIEMAAAEMDAGSELSSIYRTPVLIAAGRSDEAIASLSEEEHDIIRKAEAIYIVSEAVRFNAEVKLDDPGLTVLLQPEDYTRGRIKGLIRRGEYTEAESLLKSLWAEYPYLIILLEDHLRIVERRVANNEAEALLESLRLTIDCLTLESGRKPQLFTWLQHLEFFSKLVSKNQLSDLFPQILANAEIACGLLEKDDSESIYRAQFYSNLAATFFYCGKQERADEQIRLATEFIDRSFEELVKEIDSGSASSAKRSTTATSLLETTGHVAALLANLGRLEEARKLIQSTKTKVQTVAPDKEMNDDWAIVRMLIDYGAFELADEFVSAARSPYWRCHFQIKICEELAQRKRREDALTRLQKVIPQFSLEANPVNRFGLQSDTIRLLKTVDEEQIRSKLLKEVLDDCQSHDDPKHLQSVFLLLIAIRDYENAWRMVQERELAGSKAMNLAMMGSSMHDAEIAASGKK